VVALSQALPVLHIDIEMPKSTASRNYVIRVEGKNATVKDVMVAGFCYRVLLEEAIGSPAMVVRCFQAWTKEQSHGIDLMSKTEIAQARAWHKAHRYAHREASPLLSSPQALSFVFRLE